MHTIKGKGMGIKRIISWSMHNPLQVMIAAIFLGLLGWQSMQRIALDALPDLSDVQVIIKTPYPGQSPQQVEDQITYPLSTAMLAVPGAETVRGYSFFGDSYVYVLFKEGTDLYWARSRVLEYLNQAAQQLPAGVQPSLGPDASGVGWIYEYALVDRSGQHDLGALRSLQDWFLKLELQGVSGVAEVATVGGMQRAYQIVVDPYKLAAYKLDLASVAAAVRAANREVGGSVLELAEAEYMIRTRAYRSSIHDFESIPLGIRNSRNLPLLLKDVASIRRGPVMRRGIAELDGEGEVVGGIVVMRFGENALNTIAAVKSRLQQLQAGLPEGVELVTTYDRSQLIQRAIDNLQTKLLQEMALVALICLLFLLHARSTLVAVITLPLSVVIGFILMDWLQINANIMSLGGIAIAIGAVVDAAIVMVENAHKHLEQFSQNQQRQPDTAERWQLMLEASREVGPALFFSLLVITLSFLPVFALEDQEGRLFKPLAYTKTFVMGISALLAVTLVPVLMGLLIKGRLPSEDRNPLSRLLIRLYRPALRLSLRFPKSLLLGCLLLLASAYYPLSEMGSEFMPELEEGDLLYMPTTLPGISIGKAQQLLQQTDRLIKTVPEVERVFGKIGRAETATDPAPLTMIETTILLKPKAQWRENMQLSDIIAELQARVDIPGLTNAWVQPIKTRIDMLSTGVKTPVGIRISGPELTQLEAIGKQIEGVLAQLPATRSVYSERSAGGRYIDITPDQAKAAQYGLSLTAINDAVAMALGGREIDNSLEGRERYPINLRYPRHLRDDLEALRKLPLTNREGVFIPLQSVANIEISDGPAMIKSENGQLSSWTFVDLHSGVSIGEYIAQAQQLLAEQLQLPARYALSWGGQYSYMQRVAAKLQTLVPLTLALIFMLLYLTFRRAEQALLVMLSLPFALVGSLWLCWWLSFDFSVALAVGMIALAGVAAEFGVIMLLYLNNAIQAAREQAGLHSINELKMALEQGAVMRVRPKAMTVATIIAGLLPIMFGAGTGNEVMQKIAAPMIGGMLVAPLISMLAMPALMFLIEKRKLD